MVSCVIGTLDSSERCGSDSDQRRLHTKSLEELRTLNYIEELKCAWKGAKAELTPYWLSTRQKGQ